MIIAITLSLFALLQAAAEPPGIRYNVAFIAGVAAVLSALIALASAIFNIYRTRKTQIELAHLQSQLNLQTQLQLEKAKSEWTDKLQTNLELHKADLVARNQDDIERLRSLLGEKGRDRDARRDYEYDAHKRLYAECEPLLFQLADLAEHARHRVYSLARTARRGNLPDWLAGDGYYFRSTMYKLIAPLVVFRLIQQRLTFVDLSLDVQIAQQYRLLKLLYLTFTDPFDFAGIAPKIDYDPDAEDSRSKRKKDEQTYWRQGLYLGSLDNAIDGLILNEDGKARLKTYGEFEWEFGDTKSETHMRLGGVADMLRGFHPQSRPVLWRILWAQTLIYTKIIESQSAPVATSSRVGVVAVSLTMPVGSLDWRKAGSKVTKDKALLEPERVAREYLQTRLPEVFAQSD